MLFSLLLFLLCFSHVNGSLFSTSNPYIAAEPVTLYSNTSSIDSVDSAIEPQNYRQNIIPNSNLTQPPSSGLGGVLYDRGLSCQLDNVSNTPVPALLTDQKKIALVKRGNCTFTDKVLYSQMDGAVGVIIYNNIPFEKDPHAGIMNIPAGNINIAVYYVDLDIGMDLLGKLQQPGTIMQDTQSSNVSYQKTYKVVLYPAIGGFPSAWEFTLIVVVALLAVSFLASVGMHYHLWRIRRRQRNMMFENGVLPVHLTPITITTKRNVLDAEMLSTFPTRIIGSNSNDDQEDIDNNNHQQQQRRNSTQSERSTRSGKALENAAALASASNPSRRASLVATTGTSGDLSDAMCVICLDEFSAGETVRQLPCGHEYHCECIDPWLTVKSASCPLCKHDCSLDIPGNTEQPENDHTSSSSNHNEQQLQPPPPAAFGPTMSPEQVEALNQSWVLRTLPRTMRRQIREAAAAAHEGGHGSTMVLPARMTQDNNNQIQVEQEQEQDPQRDQSFAGRLARSLPTRWQRRR
ncbi:predicted protein [Lichtheimia corymbifera JMRC:FSU:9682]|uniref:RING-type domain-containing protein n=1 Tax=Lichtheimia corymbifera JMRC:FSU:9682 TaxID=1263082 RepID=A0A068REJ4_9FUNG|nr:predicted protein [Lichtheimia corymbifera JMRC:FSU:9682]